MDFYYYLYVKDSFPFHHICLVLRTVGRNELDRRRSNSTDIYILLE
jgi:hypothetical protein